MIKSSIVRFNLFSPKYVKMLTFIANKQSNMSQISKETGFHYSHIVSVMRQFEEDEIIEPAFGFETEEHGHNAKKITFTIKGLALKLLIMKAYSALNDKREAEKIIKLLGNRTC